MNSTKDEIKRTPKENILEVVKRELDKVKYGKITLVINGSTDFIDIVVEHRHRLKK